MTKRHPRGERLARLVETRLYWIAGEVETGSAAGLERIRAGVRGGVGAVQVRWKGATTAELIARTRAVVEVVKHEALVIVNDDVDAAIASEADGVHLGQDDTPVGLARRRLGDTRIIGLSTHSIEQARAARSCGADYIGIGAMFATQTKVDPLVIGPGVFPAVKDAAGMPCFAIGGIDEANVGELVRRGCERIAVSRILAIADDPERTAAVLRRALGD